MPIRPFTINVSVTIQPDDVRQDIEAIFDAAYRGERGSDETTGEFLQRKLEQHILDIYGSRKSQSAGAEVVRTLQKDITEAANIKQRKDKPVVVAEPAIEIGNTVPADK